MKSLANPLLVLVFIAPMAFSQVTLNLNTYVQTGAREATLSGATTSGASLLYLDNSVSGRNDTALVAPLNSGSLTSFTQVGDTMTYSFRLSGITATNNNTTPLYRVGFDFGSTAALRYETSTGTQDQLRFGSNTDGNPFASGTTTDFTTDNWTSFALQSLRFDDGNEIDATVSLELVGTGSYEMTVTYVNPADSNITTSLSHTFTGVNGNQVVSVFHATNSSGMVDGDAYTISNASLEFTAVPEPSTYALLSGMLALGAILMRRRFHRG
ncbi:PEP-CTERM sorting domain-containing protein [Puniceicoccales bacterium CK1056]|uniref:PEP-CTERM sorting domain-containing protein n=1 Tax=Oceanipulchritudo coccoides TaxID=2706888 RepID=A0A6B2M0Z8_9BACT|nr:PEP-CTERM sorting domain-containing protein [Oceanipulchritudo coccoides]NDV61717.1 PEP-CTERM sorting domain-containing protein [Oceanipulchritudo coccoides]